MPPFLSLRRLLLSGIVWLPMLLGNATTQAQSPAPPATPNFRYNILSVTNTQPGQNPVVIFSVTDPTNNNQPYDLKTHPAWTQTANGNSRLFVQIGWDTRDYHNTGSGSINAPVGGGPALPIAINALATATSLGNGTYQVTAPRPIPAAALGTGISIVEGHPAGQDASGAWTARLPVTSVYRFFPITDPQPVARRQVVDNAKCLQCHGTLALHGNNRVNETQVCVACHNPNATDAPWRLPADGPETPIDFKWLIHAIHSAKFHERDVVVIGFQHSVNNFRSVNFPADIENCLNCHIARTFELPLGANVLGTTRDTRSFVNGQKTLDADPANDLNITPTAAACSACHMKTETRSHMERNGASWSALQSDIDSGRIRERCADCHGPGKEKDVRVMHDIGKN